MVQPVRVLVVEDTEVLARGLRALAEDALPDAQVRTEPDPQLWWSQGPAADVVVCGPSALATYCGIVVDLPQPVATVAVVADPAKVDFTATLAAGIDILWDSRGSPASFAAALRAALDGQPWVSETLSARIASDIGVQLRRGQQSLDFGLTPRESEILQMLATGASNKDIATLLFISQNTVKNHVRAVLDKLHAGTRTEAVMIGVKAGLIDVRSGRP